MAAPVPLRSDFDAAELRKLASSGRDERQVRRLLALAAIYEGGTHSKVARISGVTRQIVHRWVRRFNAEGPEGLVDRKPPGRPAAGRH
jgi:transposase